MSVCLAILTLPFSGRRLTAVLALLLLAPLSAFAQNRPTSGPGADVNRIDRTIVQIVLLSEPDNSSLQGQNWRATFERLDLSFQIRRPRLEDRPEVTERLLGRLREVTATGLLRRNGEIEFPNRTFKPGDTKLINEWVQELQVYGAQGSPAGQPLWGLTQKQFEEVLGALTPPVTESLHGLSYSEAVEKLDVPETFPLYWTEAAVRQLEKQPELPRVRSKVAGFSRGFTLALMLNEANLGFQPNRLADGSIQLKVIPLQADTLVWPCGWPMETRKASVAPKLYEIRTLLFSELPLTEVATRLEEETGVPVAFDWAEFHRLKLDPETLKLDFLPRKSSWSLALRQVLNPHKLTRELVEDENGREFLWVTTVSPARRQAVPTMP